MKQTEIQNIITANPEAVFHVDGWINRNGIIRGFVDEKKDRYASTKTRFALVHPVNDNGSVNIHPIKIVLRQIDFVSDDSILSFKERINQEYVARQKQVADKEAARARMDSLVGEYTEYEKRREVSQRLADHFGVKPAQVSIDTWKTSVTVTLTLDDLAAILGE
jgi:hypothetical protein